MAFSTRAGCECVVHIVQGFTEVNFEAPVTSIDGVSACDLISREVMLTGLRNVDGGEPRCVSYVFYGRPSEYLKTNSGTVHRIPQGEGGVQGDALMPLLFAVGQNQVLEAAHRQSQQIESIFVSCTTSTMVITPEQVGVVCSTRASGYTLAKPRCGIGKSQA